jgi:preprotein translocase subunit YajC
MEMLILFVCIVVPFSVVGLYAMYRDNKEKRQEQMNAKNAESA